MQRQKYQVTITFENNDYMTTYFNALDTQEIISHYNGYTMEYYNGETTTAWAVSMKNMDTQKEEIYYYN